MRTISFEVSKSLAANICRCSLHNKGIVDEQIARFVGKFARNLMIFGQMIDKRRK